MYKKIDFGEELKEGYIFSKLIQLLGRGTHLTFFTQLDSNDCS